MRFDDEKYIDARDSFSIYMSVKLSLHDSYDVGKYGLYAERFKKLYDSPDKSKVLFEKLAKKYQTEYRLVCALAGNMIIDPSIWVTDLNEEHYIRLRKYNISENEFVDQAKSLFNKYEAKSLFKDGKLIELFVSGDISPELFSSIGIIYDYDSLFCKTSQGYVWGLLKKRLEAYQKYVIINDDRPRLISRLASILKSKSI